MTEYRRVPLGDLVTAPSTWNPARVKGDTAFTYIDLAAVDQTSKVIAAPRQVLAGEAPSRARQLVATQDVLVSTVRPNLNAVALVPSSLDTAIASTGFCVLRPNPTRLDSSYLFHWVKTPDFVRHLVHQSTGASYPAVSDRIVRSSEIPLPSLSEQHRLATILDLAETLQANRRKTMDTLGDLESSLFLEMFASPASEGWPVTTIEAVAAASPGSIRTGPFGSQLLHSEFVESGVAVLGIDNAVENQFRWARPRYVTHEKYKSLIRYTVHPGDILITIMGTCGRCAIVPEDVPVAINTKHLCCITLDQTSCLPDYLHSYFLHHPLARQYLERTAKGAVMDGLNMGIIRQVPLRLPPLSVQEKFHERLRAIESMEEAHETAAVELDNLIASLQQRAFRGEL